MAPCFRENLACTHARAPEHHRPPPTLPRFRGQGLSALSLYRGVGTLLHQVVIRLHLPSTRGSGTGIGHNSTGTGHGSTGTGHSSTGTRHSGTGTIHRLSRTVVVLNVEGVLLRHLPLELRPIIANGPAQPLTCENEATCTRLRCAR